MAAFSRDAAGRIAAATRWVERRVRSDPPGRGRWQGQGWEHWFQLDENLDTEGTADAFPVDWSAADAAYTASADEDRKVTIKDTTKQFWGLKYEWVRARWIGSDAGMVLELVHPGAQWHRGALTGTLNQGSSAGCNVTIRGQTVSLTVYDAFLKTGESLASTAAVGITYNVVTKHWEATEAKC